MRPRAAREQLWRGLVRLFEEDDGSLFDVRLFDIPSGGSARVCEELRRRAEPIEPTQTIWREELGRDVPLSDIPDVSAIIAEGGFPILLRGIRSRGVRLPDFVVWVTPTDVELSYRRGREWNADVLAAFVELLSDLRQLAPGARFDLEEAVLENVREQFRRAVEAYLAFG